MVMLTYACELKLLIPRTRCFSQFGSSSDSNEMQMRGQQSFQHLRQNAEQPWSIPAFLQTSLNHETVQRTKRSVARREGHEEDRAAPSHTNALNLQSQPGIREKQKKIRKRVIIVAAYTFINLCGLDTTSHCSVSPGASSPREAA